MFTNGNKVLLAGTRQLSAEVLFGSHLGMLHQPGRERQNQVIIVLTPVIEFMTQILVLGVRPSEIVPRQTGRRLSTWRVSSRPTMVGVPMQLQGAYTTSQPKYSINCCIL